MEFVEDQDILSKQEPSVVRWLLVESAWRAIKKSPGLRVSYERMRCGQKQNKKIAIVTVARRLLSIMRAMQKTGTLSEIIHQITYHRALELILFFVPIQCSVSPLSPARMYNLPSNATGNARMQDNSIY